LHKRGYRRQQQQCNYQNDRANSSFGHRVFILNIGNFLARASARYRRTHEWDVKAALMLVRYRKIGVADAAIDRLGPVSRELFRARHNTSSTWVVHRNVCPQHAIPSRRSSEMLTSFRKEAAAWLRTQAVVGSPMPQASGHYLGGNLQQWGRRGAVRTPCASSCQAPVISRQSLSFLIATAPAYPRLYY